MYLLYYRISLKIKKFLMMSITNSLAKHAVLRFRNQNKLRLISSNALIGGPDDSENKKDNIIIKKLTELNQWYIQFTGLDEVKRLQDRVILTQEKLEKAQEERREVGKLLVDVRKKSLELQEQLHNTKRWENSQRFLDLTKQETEVMKLEKELSAKFEILDKAEREIFTGLSNAVRDSHEKEKAQSEYTKYWGIILSIIGTIVGAVVSTLISTIRNKQIVNGINQGVEEKFHKMSGLIKQGNQTQTIESMVMEIKNESNKTSKIIIEKLNDAQRQLSELIKNKKSSVQHLLTETSLISGDKYLDVDMFLAEQNYLLEVHQNEIKKMINVKNAEALIEDPKWFVIGGIVLLIVFCLGKASS